MIALPARPNYFAREWGLLIAALALLGGLMAFSLVEERQAVGKRERERLASQARVIHDGVVRQLVAIDRTLLNLRESLPAWQMAGSAGMARASEQLKSFAEAMPGVLGLTIHDAAGTVVAAHRSDLIGRDFSQRDYFRASRQSADADRLRIGAPFITFGSGITTVPVVRSVLDQHGGFGGIISATLDPTEFAALLGSIRYADDIWSGMAHGDGVMFMMSPLRKEAIGTNLAQPGSMFSQHLESGRSLSVLEGTVMLTGEQRMLAVATVQPAELRMDKALVVATGRDHRAIYADWRRNASLRTGFFVILAIVCIGGLYYSQNRRQAAESRTRAAEEALREKSAELAGFFELSLDLLCIADFEGRFRSLNPAWERVTGYPLAELEGRRFLELVHPDDVAATMAIMADLSSGRKIFQFTNRYRCRDGSYRNIEWYAAPRLPLIYAAARDVTDSLRHEAELQRARLDAEAASRAKSQFVANMSHEIRTPMNAVMGLLQLLQHTELDEQQADYAQKAQLAARSLLGILNDILDFSKVEAGKLELENLAFRLGDVMRELAVVLTSAAQGKDIDVLFDIDADLPSVVHGDALRLQQVLLNLAGNAVKFTERGQVVVALRREPGGAGRVRIRFSVSDSGIGIAADKLKAIFEGFTQAEASTTRRYGGTGLGLAISQRLVRLMGGELSVDSVPGQGSRFSFNLDLPCAEPARDGGEASNAMAAASGLRVLVVDDNAVARTLAEQTGQHLGWHVESLADGAAALERLVATGPTIQVVLIDGKMPGMDGYETLRRIRATRLTVQPVAVLVSACDAESAAAVGGGDIVFDGYVAKPATPAMLFDAVAAALRQARGGEARIERRKRKRESDGSKPLAGLRLLVAEDNPTNQMVAEGLLAGKGAMVTLAADGRQAVDCVAQAKEPFDAVLMDIQMPVMDGLTATRVLREDLGLRSLPIVAMTANALAGDREECLAAGMAEHIGKPIEIDRVVAVLRRLCGLEPSIVSMAMATAARKNPSVTDGFAIAQALERLENNRGMYARLARRFRAEQEGTLAEVRRHLAAGDKVAAQRMLHSLKGVAAIFGAERLRKLAAEAEDAVTSAAANSVVETQLLALAPALDEAFGVLEAAADDLAPPEAGTAG